MENENLPLVSIIIPCRNEEKFIGDCLDSIIVQNYPKDRIEVLVVDGRSTDKTKEVVKKYIQKYSFIRILDNPKRITPAGMNIGIKKAKGDYILILSSHSKVGKNFIQENVSNLQKHRVDCVGGTIITLPAKENLLSQSIALALSHPFGVGNVYFRIGSKKPRFVDTVPFGCYKREVFKKIGLFDEDLLRGQDAEFNTRLKKYGGKILLVPEIVSYYYARDSLLKLWRTYFQYGYFKPLTVKKVGNVYTIRQLVPGIFVGSLVISLALSIIYQPLLWLFVFMLSSYIIVNLVFSLKISLKKGIKFFFVLPSVFSTLHFSYGLGYLKGIWDFIILEKHKKKKIEDIPLAR